MLNTDWLTQYGSQAEREVRVDGRFFQKEGVKVTDRCIAV